MSTIPPVGSVPDVVTNTVIASNWGNAVGASSRGRVVHRFNTVTERDSSITAPVAGMFCYVSATNIFYGYRNPGGWTVLGITPNVSSTNQAVTTDGFGNWTAALPTGAKVTAAVACGIQQDVNLIMIYNTIGAPFGGASIMFRAWYPSNTNPINTSIAVSWIATWTY